MTCPCGCGQKVGVGRKAFARWWVRITCTLPALRHFEELEGRGGGEPEHLTKTRTAIEQSASLAAFFLDLAHGADPPLSQLGVGGAAKMMDDWERMAFSVVRYVQAADPAYYSSWWATRPWSHHPTFVPGVKHPV